MKRACACLLLLVLALAAGRESRSSPVPPASLEIPARPDSSLLPYEVEVRRKMAPDPSAPQVVTPFQIHRGGPRPGDSILVVFAYNPSVTTDNPAMFSYQDLTTGHVINDNPVRLTIADFRLCPDAARGDTVVVGAGFRRDSAFAVKFGPAEDSVAWLFLAAGEDHTGDGHWQPSITCVGLADYDYDARHEILFYLNAVRDLVPRVLVCIEVETFAVEWTLPVATGVMAGQVHLWGNPADPGLIFVSYNSKQGVSDSLFSDSWAYVTAVDRTGRVRFNRVIAAEHGGIAIIPAEQPGEYYLGHSTPLTEPADTLAFLQPVRRVSRISTDGAVLDSSPPLSAPVRALWVPPGAGDSGVWVLTQDGTVSRFDRRLRLMARSAPSHLRSFQGTIDLPGRSEPAWLFGSELGAVVMTADLKPLAVLPAVGEYRALIAFDPEAERASYVFSGGGGALIAEFDHRPLWSVASNFLWRYHLHLSAVAIALLVTLVIVNRRRLQVQRLLRQREADFLAFCQASPDLVFRINRDGVITDFHAREHADLLLPPEVFLNRPLSESLPPAVAGPAMEAIGRALDTGAMESLEYDLDQGGERRHWELRMAPVDDCQVLTVIRDWTDRARAENELRESEERFRMLFHGSRDAYVIADAETGKVIDLNARAEALIGRPRDRLIGRHVSEMAPPDIRANFGERYKRHLEIASTGKWINGVVCGEDGRRCPVEISHTLIEIGGRSVLHTTLRDVSERLATEAALRRSEDRLAALVANIPAAIYRCLPGEARLMEFVSNEITTVTGYESAVFEPGGGTPYASIVHRDDRSRVSEVIAAAVAGRRPFSAEYRIVRADGEVRWVHERGQAVAGPDGTVAFLDGAIYDITEQRAAIDALHESEEKMRAQYKGIPVPTYTWQRAGDDFVLADYNDAAVAITGGTIALKAGIRLSLLYADRPDLRADIARCFDEQTTIRREMDYTFQSLDRTVSLIVHYVYVPPDLVMVHTEDVTDRVRSRQQLATRLRYEEGLVGCSLTLLQTPVSAGALNDALYHLLTALDSCRVYVYQNFTDPELGLCAREVYEVCRPGVRPTLGRPELQRRPYAPQFASMRDRLAAGRPVGGVVAEMSEPVRSVNAPCGVLSVLTLPVFVRGQWYGFIGFDDTRSARRWSEEDVRLLRAAAAMVGSYLEMIEANRELAAERDFTRMVLQTANSLICCLDERGCITVFNDELERVTGYRREEVLGRSWHELFLPERFHHPGLVRFGQWVRDHPADRYERALLTRTGEERIILWSNSMLEDPHTGVVTAIAIGHDITDRKHMETAVRESEEKYRAVMEQSADFIYLAQADSGRIIEANRSLREMLGYSVEEMCGISLFDFVDHDSGEVREGFRKVLAGGLPFLRERYYRTRDGRRIPVEVGVNEIVYGGHKVLCIVSRDISERKAAEESVRQQEEKYRLLVENVRASIILVDAEGYFLFVNQNAAQAVGRRPEELIGRTEWDIFPEDLADRQMSNVRRVIAEDKEFISEAPVYLRGEWRWFYNNVQPYRDLRGRTVAALVIAHDITMAKRAEEALRESEERFRELADLLPQTVFETDVVGRLTYSNRHGFESTGYTSADLEAGLTVDQLFLESDRAEVRANFAKRLAGENPQRYEYTHLRKDGSTFPVLIYSSRIVRDGLPAGLRGVVVDITERKRAEEEVRRANLLRYQQMREIAGGVSHEIYNSLYPAIATLEKLRGLLAASDTTDLARTERLMQLADRAVRRAISLTETVTQYARLESQRRVERVRLAGVIQEIVEQNRHAAEELAATITADIPADLFVTVGKSYLYSLFNNLVINALDAVAEVTERAVSIAARPDDGRVRIVVRDTGPGIPFEIQQRAFEPFFTTKLDRGTGLGLAVAKRIVELYDGQIGLESALDRGTTFIILLPGGSHL